MRKRCRHIHAAKAKILAMLIAGMTAAVLAGCGSAAEETKAPEETSSAAVQETTSKAEEMSVRETETVTAESEAEAAETVPETEAAEEAVYYAPQPGEAVPAIEGSYSAGRVVVFDDAAYISQPDGIYRLDQGSTEPELLVSAMMDPESEICTDGWMLYYCGHDGAVMELDLKKKGAKPVRISDKSLVLPKGSGVTGASHHSLYLEVNNFAASEEEEDYYTGGLPDVIRMDRKSGLAKETFEGCFGGCGGGLTYVAQDGFDVSPRELKIFDFQDHEIVDEPGAWSVTAEQGTVWYSISEEDSEYANAVLYKIDVDEAEEVLRCEEENGTFYGITVGGFLACVHYFPDDDGLTNGTRWIDLRSMQPVDESLLRFAGQDPVYWGAGYTVAGTDYLTEYNRVCRVGKDGLTDIFDLPADVFGGGIYLTEKSIIVPDMENRVLIYDLDPEGDVHTIPVTSYSMSRREIGTEGLTVTEQYPQLMTEGAYHWPALCRALDQYNSFAEARVRVNAKDCYDIAESLAESGLFKDYEDPPLRSVVNAYIQRADTLCFSLMDHEYADPVVGPKNYEVKTGYNYAPEDGHEIGLEEVVTDLNALAEMMIAHLEENFPNERLTFSPADFVDDLLSRRSLKSTKELSWVLGYEGVSFYFNGSVNFPFTRGSWKYYVAFSEHPEIFDEKWFDTPEDYSYDVIVDDYFAEDYQIESEDGIETALFVAERARDEEGYPLNTLDGLQAWISPTRMFEMRQGSTVEAYIWSDTLKGMILHEGSAGGGKNYLLLQYNGDSMELETFAIEGGFRSVGNYPLTALPQYCPENGVDAVGRYVTHAWLSDPDHFTVMTPDKEHPENGYTQRNFVRMEGGEIVD